MSGGLEFDAAASRQVEAMYQTPDVAAQRVEVLRALDLQRGEHVLDVGSGPGLLAAEIAAAVGPDGRVAGIDTSDAMLAMAQSRCAEQSWAAFENADAAKLPYADATFDAAVSTQVYEYVPDISGAFAELYRVVRPGGRAIILDSDFGSLVWHTREPARMARVLAAWDEHFVHPHLPRVLALRLREAGFVVRGRSVIPIFNPEYHSGAFSFHMIGVVAAFVVGRNGLTQDEVDAWAAEFETLGQTGEYFYSLNRYLFVAHKPA